MSQLSQRIFYIDALRGVLMVLGVVLHSAQVFNPMSDWLISSTQTNIVFSYLVSTVAVFRMPAFFVVSGYFCLLTYIKYQPAKFLRLRLTRLVIPLISAIVILNTVQTLILSNGGWYQLNWSRYISQGDYIYHLWFLVNLLCYFLLFFIASLVVNRLGVQPLKWLTHCLAKIDFILVIILLPIISLSILMLPSIGLPIYWKLFGVIDFYSLLHYAPYFLFGLFLASKDDLLERFTSINRLFLLGLLVLAIAVKAYIKQPESITEKLVFYYAQSLLSWIAIALCFYVFKRFFNHAKSWISYLAAASYTIYLFHHVFVLIFGSVLIALNVPALIGFVVLVLLTSISSILCHELMIKKSSILSILFNGKALHSSAKKAVPLTRDSTKSP
ncbi:acyltransferase family protein [Thalassotalea ponticola]|uniref:acyltransferase family protein n=1 Tax=Thalassotalea ponticola TaxID=1523392 RepID=UPI0025B398CB|nr:acyltransferase family protein [Thalassotalea ponticola]MDN3652435.1 acyltransferase family protein [Thalassotalea ponticola]